MEILKAENLSKIYQTGESSVYALNEVNLSIKEGSFVAVTGPSGSGKSTLLHLLSGLDKPTKGNVFYQNKNLYKYSDNQLSVLRRRRFGFVFQSYNLVKELTYSSMAAARLRANRRQYLSLALGIFLAIFLVTTLFLAAQGYILAQAEQTDKNVGKLDAFLVDEPELSDEALLDFDRITEVGHVYVTASVAENDSYLGYYDDAATEHMHRTILEGRMPESAGEIAIEQSALLALDLDRNWQIGDSIVLSLIPIDGQSEERTFTLAGILKDQTEKLNAYKNMHTSKEYVKQFPALLTSSEEAAFDSGRIAVHRTFLIDGGKLADPYIDKFYDTVGLAG